MINYEDYPKIELNSDITQSFSDGKCTRCPVCDKIFFVPSITTYAYKIKNINYLNRYLCSWKCLNIAKPLTTKKKIYRSRDTVELITK